MGSGSHDSSQGLHMGENRCDEINTSSHGLSLHFSAPVKYRGRVLGKRSLAGGAEEMESFVRHPKASEGFTDGEEGDSQW